MKVRDIQKIIESWAPAQLAWERDNPGLQCGSPEKNIKKILVALDVSEDVVEEARRRGAELIISHHPLLFHPIKSCNTDERTGKLLSMLLRYDIAAFSAHTNLDFTEGGVSAVLANKLKLSDVDVLLPDRKIFQKVVVFVPGEFTEPVRMAMANAGAGKIGEYDTCSFQTDGMGTFRPLTGANPYIGSSGTLEHVREQRIEMIVPEWKMSHVISAMRAVHPYEEVAYDIIPLGNTSQRHGAGAIGTLPRAYRTGEFLKHAKKALGIPVLRYGGSSPRQMIRRVAVAGGAGSELLPQAIRCNADALITADVTYHRFEEAGNRILLVDGGHYETEFPIIRQLVGFLTGEIQRAGYKVQVFATTKTTNTVRYHLS